VKVVKALLMDCDEVLTDGTSCYSKDGKVMKLFSTLDSKRTKLAQEQNIHLAVITKDDTGFEITKVRCRDMELPLFQAANAEEKLTIAKKLVKEWGINLAECAFIGDDDMMDGYMLNEVGMPIVVANATEKAKQIIRSRGGYCTAAMGGHGAVGEAVEYILSYNEKEIQQRQE